MNAIREAQIKNENKQRRHFLYFELILLLWPVPLRTFIYTQREAGEIGVESACLLHFSPPDREKIEYCRTVLQLLQDCSAGEGGTKRPSARGKLPRYWPVRLPNQTGAGGGVCGCRWTDWSRTIGELENNLYIYLGKTEHVWDPDKAGAAGIEEHVERAYRG